MKSNLSAQAPRCCRFSGRVEGACDGVLRRELLQAGRISLLGHLLGIPSETIVHDALNRPDTIAGSGLMRPGLLA